jgi:hypothetical protein
MPDKRSMMSQLASVSEGALGKLASSDLSKSALQGALMLKERMERLVMGMTELDDRMDALEKRVAALEKPKGRAPAKKSAAAGKTTASAAKKKAASPAKASASAAKRTTG